MELNLSTKWLKRRWILKREGNPKEFKVQLVIIFSRETQGNPTLQSDYYWLFSSSYPSKKKEQKKKQRKQTKKESKNFISIFYLYFTNKFLNTFQPLYLTLFDNQNIHQTTETFTKENIKDQIVKRFIQFSKSKLLHNKLKFKVNSLSSQYFQSIKSLICQSFKQSVIYSSRTRF